MDAKKVSIILLILLLVVFLVVRAISSDEEQDQNAKLDSGYWFEGVFDTFVKKRKVLPDELGGSNFVIRQGNPYSKRLPKADGVHIREMNLTMTQGVLLKILLEPIKGERGVPVELELKGTFRTTPKLQVFEKGATLTATCVVPDPVLNACGLQLTN